MVLTPSLRRRVVFVGFPWQMEEAVESYKRAHYEVVEHLGGKFVESVDACGYLVVEVERAL